MLTLNDGRNELWQWDTGRKITVDAECSQVHFSNKVFGRSIDVDVVDGTAIIPDILLQTDKDLNVWAFVGTSENGYTKISKTFKVNRRNKPADYVFTPPDQTTLEEIKEKIEHLESIQDPDAIKNAVEDYLEQNPVEVPVQSVNGKTGKVDLTAKDVGAISQDDLQEATNKALEQAKEGGEFDGKDGYTPVKGVDYFDGQPGYTPQKGVDYFDGDDYVLTDEDKTEIAEQAAGLVEIPDSGGNVAYDEAQNLTDEQKAQARENIGAQPKGNYLDSTELNNAINTALAQAKESGEFDGEDGKDGVVAVTGATVGQTVKISAVDENGVPTAWLPVDFPSGGSGGEWKHIGSVTLEETTAYIMQEIGGSYNNVLIEFENLLRAEGNSSAINVSVNRTPASATDSFTFGTFIHATSAARGLVEFEKILDCVRVTGVGCNASGNGAGSGLGLIPITVTGDITKVGFSLSGYATSKMAAGAVFDFYGR